MSTTDLAFIKAYYHDQPPPPQPLPTGGETAPATRRPAPVGAAQAVRLDEPAAPAHPSTAHPSTGPADTSDSDHPTPSVADVPLPKRTTPAPSTEKRPLSSFGEAPQPPDTAFRPQRYVDRFALPDTCSHLTHRYSTALATILERVLSAGDEGKSLFGLASRFRGEGVSTILFCVARALAARGASVAVVDGDFEHASLAKLLQLDLGAGWDDLLRGDVLLADIVIQSHADAFALLPIRAPSADGRELINSLQTSVTAGVLRNAYDFVIFDLGSLSDERNLATASRLVELARIDVTMFVVDPARTTAAALEAATNQIRDCGSEVAGIIENFTDEETRTETTDRRRRPFPEANCTVAAPPAGSATEHFDFPSSAE